ncbi:diaminopimelate epimerase [Gloeomargarita lithophora Alchichica-D10]|uniref:Diaminopimelate epimerase n=1 Tax=Gloeomargarita lithophora Alchichica-D10 TaxID=1188229 RepID=A0A1J0AEM0_9CYAN|nr:diaminopimelate epimerase [Gloeomargarita lithophora]APB34360.1 diaminopimelate epimerase [Gloeomargarita lithophora Alchichica-D10]
MATPFWKYHALGNDYLVLDPERLDFPLQPLAIQRLCHRHFGVGSDGILLGPLPAPGADFGLRIFNPDGSEAEKSGNGLRIFARYLWDGGKVGGEPFYVQTLGGLVQAQVQNQGQQVQVAMGRVSFQSGLIPVTGADREVIQEPIQVQGQTFTFSAATIGNPHCVILVPEATPALAQTYGSALENHAFFPQRTNVQFVQVLSPERLRLEIWERGAGYTLASGSSSSAAAAVVHRLGLCAPAVTVEMPGGELAIRIAPDFAITMTGPVTGVAQGILASDIFAG